MRERLYLLSVISLVVLLWGCGSEESDVKSLPRVVDVNVKEGMEYPDNMTIAVIFSKEMKSVKIDISGYDLGSTVFGPTNKTVTWTPSSHEIPCGDDTILVAEFIPLGIHTLTITGMDIYGNELEEFTPINFKISAPD